MKQGTVFTRIIFLMLLLALIVYAVSAAFTSMEGTITTVTAIAYEVGDGFQTTGFVVRDEQVLTAPGGISVLLRSEGERVAKGEALAATYADAEAQEAQQRIDMLEQELQRYETVLDAVPIEQGNTVLDEQIEQDLRDFAAQTVRGNLSGAASCSNDLKSLVLRRYLDNAGRADMQKQAQSIRAELANLRSKLAGAVTQKNAATAGYFSGSTDGYEKLMTPERIMTMSPAEVEKLSELEPEDVSGAIGRLIVSPQWYFVCAVPQEKLRGCGVGDRLQVEFAYDFSQSLSMKVERISDPMDGQQVLVLSSEDYMSDATCLRAQTADVVLHSYSGIRVPKQTVYFDNENARPGVYILEGARVRWKPIELVYEAADYYIVRLDKSNTANLWPGDEIIFTTGELYDGKVIE